MKKIDELLFGGAKIYPPLANVGVLLLRVFTGLSLAFAHGINKVPPSERFIAGVAKLGFQLPEVFAWAAAFSEFFGGILLALGLLTRPASFFILMTMLIAGFVRHAPDPFGVKELAFIYASVAIMFLLLGSGRFGVDALLRRKEGKSPSNTGNSI